MTSQLSNIEWNWLFDILIATGTTYSLANNTQCTMHTKAVCLMRQSFNWLLIERHYNYTRVMTSMPCINCTVYNNLTMPEAVCAFCLPACQAIINTHMTPLLLNAEYTELVKYEYSRSVLCVCSCDVKRVPLIWCIIQSNTNGKLDGEDSICSSYFSNI